MSTESIVCPRCSPLIILIYLLSKALCQVEGTFHLLIGWQIWVGLLPARRCCFNSNTFLPGFSLGNYKLFPPPSPPPLLPQLNNDMHHLPQYLLAQLEALLHLAITSSFRGRWKPARLRRSLTIWPLMETSSAVLEWRLQKQRIE